MGSIMLYCLVGKSHSHSILGFHDGCHYQTWEIDFLDAAWTVIDSQQTTFNVDHQRLDFTFGNGIATWHLPICRCFTYEKKHGYVIDCIPEGSHSKRMDHPKIMVVILLVHYLLLNHDSSLICCGFPHQHKGLSQLFTITFRKVGLFPILKHTHIYYPIVIPIINHYYT